MGEDENLSPYAWMKAKMVELIKIIIAGLIYNMKLLTSLMYTDQDKFMRENTLRL